MRSCAQAPIEYGARASEAKLNALAEGLGNIAQLAKKRHSWVLCLLARCHTRRKRYRRPRPPHWQPCRLPCGNDATTPT